MAVPLKGPGDPPPNRPSRLARFARTVKPKRLVELDAGGSAVENPNAVVINPHQCGRTRPAARTAIAGRTLT
jgi:hypothetical protein